MLRLICLSIALSLASPLMAADWGIYAAVLKEHVSPGVQKGMAVNQVDYARLKQDGRWPAVVARIAQQQSDALVSENARKAFYLNAYNILAIDRVLQHWPLRRLKDLGTVMDPVWAHPAGIVAGEPTTLRQLEHDVLRAMGDPLIHFGLNCASISCPDLRREPFVAEKVNAQLDDQARRFLSQTNKGVRVGDSTLLISPLFDWFAADFGGAAGVRSFIDHYRPDLAEHRIAGFLRYEWGINGHLSRHELRQLQEAR